MRETKELKRYTEYLFQRELSKGTIDIYTRQAALFLEYLDDRSITKGEMMAYKNFLCGQGRKASTTNLYIIAVNSYIKFAGYEDCTIRTQRLQRSSYPENVISMDEYRQMISYARESGRVKYYYLIRVLVFTGMRVSELAFLTAEVLPQGKFMVTNKGRTREVYLPARLVAELNEYCQLERIQSGTIFMGNSSRPISRIAVYKMLTHMADMLGVEKKKAHPHSFRHLFAVTYMRQYANLTELADILGHSSLETTRIYTATTPEEKRSKLDGLEF